ncbi:hypothetical protein FKP32DRAFT_1589183 [Trametes sanguinea]|nr:hypothetical protein FKP32DRAFT_1589183 [Trametes sanguinea]
MQLSSVWSILAALLAATCVPSACAAASSSSSQNVTVDDTLGSPDGSLKVQYLPQAVWKTGQNCTNCEVKTIDKSSALNGTWHEAEYNVSLGGPVTATLFFEGSAIYAYGMVPHDGSNVTSNIYLSFVLDDTDVGAFVRTPDGNGSTEYNVLLFSKDGLSSARHNLTVQVGNPQFGGPQSVALLDYFVVTKQDSSSTTSAAVGIAPRFLSTSSLLAFSSMILILSFLLGA